MKRAFLNLGLTRVALYRHFCKRIRPSVTLQPFFCICLLTMSGKSYGQGITINAGSCLVMNGSVQMVINNGAFVNNGRFSESKSTVKFSGNSDTTIAYIGGNTSTFYNLTSSRSNYGLALKTSSKVRNVLNVNGGNLYTDSNLTLLSDAALTARVDVVPSGVNIIGKANVERYFPERRAWRLLTAPVTNSNTFFKSWQNNGIYTPGRGIYITGPNPTGAAGNGLDVSPQNNISIKSFNYTTQAFLNLTNSNVPVSAGNSGAADNTAYFVFVRGDRTFDNFYTTNCNNTIITSIGNLQTGVQTFPCAKDSAKFTMIGNPYASPIDFNSVIRNNVVKRFFVYDPRINDIGGWVMMDDIDGDGIYTKSVGASNMTKDIQSGQGFMVQTSGNVASASITFTETCKSGNNNNTVFRPTGNTGIEYIRSNLFLLNPDTTILADGVLSEFKDGYSTDVNMEDAAKVINSNENIGLIRKGLTFTVERRPIVNQNDTIFIKIWKTVQRNYQFVFEAKNMDHPGLDAYLEDKFLKTSTPVNLTGTTKINFSIDANAGSADMERFRIVFRQGTILPVTIASVSASRKSDKIILSWKVENEINISRYVIEKSADGQNFTEAGIQPVTGAHNNENEYSWIDNSIFNGNNFYRVRIINADGKIQYSAVVKVSVDDLKSGIAVYPNPVKDHKVNIQFRNQEIGIYGIRLLNNAGQLLLQESVKVNSPDNTNSIITLKGNIPPAIYQMEITSPSGKHNVVQLKVE